VKRKKESYDGERELQVRVQPTLSDKYVAIILIDEIFICVGPEDDDPKHAIVVALDAAKPMCAAFNKKYPKEPK